jgi:hypothetical protein
MAAAPVHHRSGNAGMSVLEYLSRTTLLCRDYVADSFSDEEICRSFQSVRVLCVSDIRNLSSHAGQVGIITLVSLLSRIDFGIYTQMNTRSLLVISHTMERPPYSLQKRFAQDPTQSPKISPLRSFDAPPLECIVATKELHIKLTICGSRNCRPGVKRL